MDSSAPILQATNLHKRYGATTALDEVSFSLYPGEVCGLLGENGAGKSTLVKILSGIVIPDAGEIILDRLPFRPRNIRSISIPSTFRSINISMRPSGRF